MIEKKHDGAEVKYYPIYKPYCPEIYRKFLRMAERSLRLKRPNIFANFDIGTDNDSCFYVVQIMPWGSLKRIQTPAAATSKGVIDICCQWYWQMAL